MYYDIVLWYFKSDPRRVRFRIENISVMRSDDSRKQKDIVYPVQKNILYIESFANYNEMISMSIQI